MNSSTINEYNVYVQNLIDILELKVIQKPLIDINKTCKPKPLKETTSSDCLVYPNTFDDKIRNKNDKVKIAHTIQLGFDVDTLEILLNELYDVIDLFFIIESTKTNYKYISKPLIWENLKHTAR
eukprot:426001_1